MRGRGWARSLSWRAFELVVTSKRAFDAKLESLRALRGADDPALVQVQLGKALADRNNYFVARAAALVAELRCEALIPDLLAAFDRFFVDPVKSDPQCLAKSAIAEALKQLEQRGPEPYRRGIEHFQFEPTFGGSADTAAGLRATCALALADSLLPDLEILAHLADALADPEKEVRINSAIALNNLGRLEGALLLRLKALSGDAEPDVLGHCFTSLLNLAPNGVAFISRFLESRNGDVRLEAASALAQCRDVEAIQVLKEFWKQPLLSVEERRALLINLGASPLPEAADFLVGIVASEAPTLAASAIAALGSSRFRTQLAARVAESVATRDDPILIRAFEESFGAAST